MRSAFESIMSRKPGGDGRYAPIVLVATLGVFVALVLSTSWRTGHRTPRRRPRRRRRSSREVEAGIRRGQLNVLGTAKSERIALG